MAKSATLTLPAKGLSRRCACGGICPRCRPAPRNTPVDLSLPIFVQHKLNVGATDDPLEAEADRMAEHVVHGSNAPFPSITTAGGTAKIRRFPPPSEDQLERAREGARLPAEYHELISKAEQYGLPVKFLQIVEQGVTMVSAGVNDVQYDPTFNKLSLHEPSMRSSQELDPSSESYSKSNIPTNLYHESTHAWFDLMKHDPVVADFIDKQTEYYTGAPVESGGATNEPYRLFMEAAATYVEHQVQHWWFALKWLSFGAKDGLIDDAFVADTRRKYDTAMAEDVFGYSFHWVLAYPPREQTATTRPISSEFKRFMDERLLEGKISDHFDNVTLFAEIIANSAAAPPAGETTTDSLQRKATGSDIEPWIAPAEVKNVLATPGAPIDQAVRRFMEPRFGQSFEDVRTHTDVAADTAARAVAARAFTADSHIVFAAGQYAPQSVDGRKLLAHELAHVVQMSRLSGRGARVIAPGDSPLEQEAARCSNSFAASGGPATPDASPAPVAAAHPMVHRAPRVAGVSWSVQHGDVSQGNAIDLLAVAIADLGLAATEARRLAQDAAQRTQWTARRDLYVTALDFLRDNRGLFDLVRVADLIPRVLDFCDSSSVTAAPRGDAFYEALLVDTVYSAEPGAATFTHANSGSVLSVPGRPAGATDFAPSGTNALLRTAPDRDRSVSGGFSARTDLLVNYGALGGNVAASSVRVMLNEYTSRIPSQLRGFLEVLATDPTIFSVIQRFLGADGGRFVLQSVGLGGAHYSRGRPPSIEVDPRIMPGSAPTPAANVDLRTTLAHELYHYALDRTDAAIAEIGRSADHRLIDIIEDRYRVTELIRAGLPPISDKVGALDGWVGGDQKPFLNRLIQADRTSDLRTYARRQDFFESLVFSAILTATSGNQSRISGRFGSTADFLLDPAQLTDLTYLAAINALVLRRALTTGADRADASGLPLSSIWSDANYRSTMTSFIASLVGRASHNRTQGIAAIAGAI